MDSQKPSLKVINTAKQEEYIVTIPPSASQMTRQRIRATERDAYKTYINHGDQRICEFVFISKRTRAKRKRALKRKESELNANK